jgi:hypothetical protein
MDFLITILTIVIYFLSNSFSFKLGSELKCEPLYDVMHNILPNLSKNVHIRDWVLICMIIPIVFIKSLWIFIPNLWYKFMVIVFIKAISIFFTSIPSSHPSCQQPNYLDLNHCHHQSVSGHAAFAMLIGLLYIKAGINPYIIGTIIFFYCILILLSRAHYTVDIIHGVLFALLV